MKPLLFGLLLATATTPAYAQTQDTNPFTPFFEGPVTSRSQKMTLAQLSKHGSMALISLRQPLNGSKQAMVVAWGREAVLIALDGALQLKPMAEVAALYSGEARTPVVAPAALQVDNAVQIVPISSLGSDAEVLAHYKLRNTGKTPLDVSVASTSCGCTSAKSEKSRLGAGESTQLTATMHADNERMVSVRLLTSDPVQGHMVVALQSKRTFAPFSTPAPLSLYGEKGQSISSTTQFALPQGWKVVQVHTSPDWLQVQFRPLSLTTTATSKVAGHDAPLPLFSLTATAPDSSPEGMLQGQVRLELEGAPVQSLSVPIGGFISNDISVLPRMVLLKESPTGLARRVVVVRGPRPFSIRAITSDWQGFETHFEPSIEAKAHAVELLLPVAGEKGQAFFRRAIVELSDGRELSLDITGTIGEGTLPPLAQNVVLNALAPAFAGTDSQGQAVSLADFQGKSNVLVTFFPHCFTGGCESHLASLRDASTAIEATGTRIVAVSTDDLAQVKAFAAQLRLPFPVVSDTSRQVALSYGAVQNATEAPSRFSVLIDTNGKVRWIDTDVHVLTHGADVLAKINELGLK